MGQREDRFTQLTQPAGCTLRPAFPPGLDLLFPGWAFLFFFRFWEYDHPSTSIGSLTKDYLQLSQILGYLFVPKEKLFHVCWMKERNKLSHESFVLFLGLSLSAQEVVKGLQDACQVKRSSGFPKTGCPLGKNRTFSLCEKVTLYGWVLGRVLETVFYGMLAKILSKC